jgi:hypothetical protein
LAALSAPPGQPAPGPAAAEAVEAPGGALLESLQETLATLLESLEGTALATAVRESSWFYPAAELLHILGFVLLVGAAAMFDLRLLGLSRTIPVRALAGHLLPWSRAGLLVAVPTGLLMFAPDATAMAANPAFRLKLLLILAGGLNALAFHLGPFRSVRDWDRHAPAPARARLAAVLSLLIWTAVIAAGRLIAYV